MSDIQLHIPTSLSSSSFNDDAKALSAWIEAIAVDSAETKKLYITASRKLLWITQVFLKKSLSELTVANIKTIHILIENPTPEIIAGSQGLFKQSLSDNSRYTYLKTIHYALTWLNSVNYLENTPHKLVKIAKLRKKSARIERVLLEEQIGACMNAADELLTSKPIDYQCGILFYLFWGTSARANEVRHIRWQNLIDNGHYYSLALIETKTGEPREVALVNWISDILLAAKDFLEKAGYPVSPDNFIMCKRNGEQYSNRQISNKIHRVFDRAAELCEIENISTEKLSLASAHWLRHTSATQQIKKSNVSLNTLSKRLGHSSLTSTSIYTHSDIEDQYSELKDFVF